MDRCGIAIKLSLNCKILDHIQSGLLRMSSNPCMHDILLGCVCVSALHDLSSYFMVQNYHIWSV